MKNDFEEEDEKGNTRQGGDSSPLMLITPNINERSTSVIASAQIYVN